MSQQRMGKINHGVTENTEFINDDASVFSVTPWFDVSPLS